MVRIPLHSQRAATALALVSAAFTTATGVLAHAVRGAVDWRIVLAMRATIALAVTAVIARQAGHRLTLRVPRAVWTRSLSSAGIMVAFFYAYARLPASDVLVLSNTFPLWLALLSVVVLGHRLRASVLAALVLVVAGVALVERPHLALGGVVVVVLAASLLIAVATLLLARLRAVPSSVLVGHALMVSLGTSVVLMFAPFGSRLPFRSLGHVGPIAALALVGVGVTGAAAQMLYARACQLGRSTRVAVAAVADVPLACLFDAIVGNRTFDVGSLLGVSLVLGPAVFLMLHPAESCHVVLAPVAPAATGPLDPSATDLRLRPCIEHLERATACEIRVHVEPEGEPSAALLENQFAQLMMATTIRRNALLVVLWPRAGVIGVLADEGISDVMSRRSLYRSLRAVASDNVVDACAALTGRLTALLAPTFPHPTDDTNELPDTISWGDRPA